MTVFNVGDSRITIAVSTQDGFEAEPVSIDHKPDLPVEKVSRKPMFFTVP